jgi:hypothetical protein
MSNDNIYQRIQALERAGSEMSAQLLAVASQIYKQQEMNALLAKGLLRAKEDSNSMLEILANMPGVVGTEAGAEIKKIFNRNISSLDQLSAAISTVLVSFQKPPPPPPGDGPTS